MKRLIMILPLCLLLTGCWDMVELENRGFVISIGIDKNENDGEGERYEVSMALANVSALADKNGSDEEMKTVKTADDTTVSEALRQADSFSSHKLYYGHTKVCVFSQEILEDEKLFKEALDALERNRDISRKIILLASEDTAKEILSAKSPGEPMVGMFVSNYYKNNKKTASTAFRHDLWDLTGKLRMSGNAIIPKIQLEEDEVKIGGAAVIKNSRFEGWLDDEMIRGYLWIKNNGVGAQITAEHFGISIPLKVNRIKSSLHFSEAAGGLSVTARVNLEGVIEEFIFNDETLFEQENIEELKNVYETVVAEDILNTADIFQNQYEVDAFEFSEALRKQDYQLYKKFYENWEEVFSNMEIIPEVHLKISNTGAIK